MPDYECATGRWKTVAYRRDEMTIRIADVLMKVRRCSNMPVPSEITVVIPHAEIKRRFDECGRKIEEELILDSVTIVDSPRHESSGGHQQLPAIPYTTWRYLPGGRRSTMAQQETAVSKHGDTRIDPPGAVT
jgi:hypothetical protein